MRSRACALLATIACSGNAQPSPHAPALVTAVTAGTAVAAAPHAGRDAPTDPDLFYTPPQPLRIPRPAQPAGMPVLQRGTRSIALVLDPTGSRLASSDGAVVAIWDVATQEVRARFTIDLDWASAAAFSPDGELFGVADKHELRIIDLVHARVADVISCGDHRGGRTSLAWTNDGLVLVVACRTSLRIFDRNATAEAYAIHLDDAVSPLPVAQMLSPDGTRIAYIADPKSVVVRALADGARLARLTGSADVHALAWRPDGRELAVASETGVQTYDATWQPATAFTASTCAALVYAPSGDQLAIAHDAVVSAWTPATDTAELVASTPGAALAWPQAGTIIVDGHVTTGPPWREATTPLCVDCNIVQAWSRDGAVVASSVDRDIVVWDVATAAPRATLPGALGGRWRDRKWTFPGGAIAYDVSTGQVHPLAGHDDVVSPDGTLAVHQVAPMTWEIREIATGHTVAIRNLGVATDLWWSGDGTVVYGEVSPPAKGPQRGVLRSWRARDLSPLHGWPLPAATTGRFVVVPGTALLVSSTLQIAVDLEYGTTHKVVPTSNDNYPPVATARSGSRFALGRRVWATSPFRRLADAPDRVLGFRPGHEDEMLVEDGNAVSLIGRGKVRKLVTDARGPESVTFSDDGSRVSIVSHDGKATLWDVDTGAQMAVLDASSYRLLGNRCVERLDVDRHIVRIDTGATLDFAGIDAASPGLVAVRSDGAFEADAVAMTHIRIRPSQAVVGGALVAPTAAPVKEFAMVAAFVAGCR
jgi:WD40 repeat protein